MKNINPENTKAQDFQWSLSGKRIDSTRFLREIIRLLDSSETVFIEGTSISEEAENLYTKYRAPGKYLPGKGVIWPKSKTFICNASAEFFNELAELSQHKAEPELFDHFFIYRGQSPFIEWWDAFSDPMILSSSVSESDVYNFAGKLGLKIEKLKKPKG
jgi:hypothetical protein